MIDQQEIDIAKTAAKEFTEKINSLSEETQIIIRLAIIRDNEEWVKRIVSKNIT